VPFVEVARRYLDGPKGFTPLTEEVNSACDDEGAEAHTEPPRVELGLRTNLHDRGIARQVAERHGIPRLGPFVSACAHVFGRPDTHAGTSLKFDIQGVVRRSAPAPVPPSDPAAGQFALSHDALGLAQVEDTAHEKPPPDSQEEDRAERFGGQSSLYGTESPHAGVIGSAGQ